MVTRWPKQFKQFTDGTGEYLVESWLKRNKKRFIKQLNVCDYHTTCMIKIKENKNELILFDEIAREIASPLRDVIFLNIGKPYSILYTNINTYLHTFRCKIKYVLHE